MAVELTYREAVREALADALREDRRVLLMGEDVGRAGGSFKATVGLFEEFGPERVMDTPISETGFTGAALGMAITGLRPVVELMFADFMLVTMDQIVNSIAKYRYMSGGQTAVPITIRALGGAGLRFGSQHSATAESWLLPFPGLKVVCPASPADVYHLLRAAIADDDPVIVVEHKALYGIKGSVDKDAPPSDVWKARVLRAGTDATIVATLAMVQRSLQAAELLSRDGIEVEVVDARVLRPFDLDTVVDSVKRTKRLFLVAEESPYASWTGMVAMRVTQRAFDYIEAPPEDITPPEAPVPFSPVLEDAYLPSPEAIAQRVRESLG
jgi:pyruvate/2-oxoglutarate/acetoin dehydrogenase E1 component